MATITCKTGYKKPIDKNLHEKLICLESGAWSYNKFKCDPACGQLTPKAREYVLKGFDADISEIPWHVGIYKYDFYFKISYGSCKN